MTKIKKILLVAFLVTFVAAFTVACSSSGTIASIEIDENTISEPYDVNEFDISKINLIITYVAASEEVEAETESIPLTLNMIKAEDHIKLSIPGTHTITVMYKQMVVSFQLILQQGTAGTYKVSFFDDEGNKLGSVQNVASGEAALTPEIPQKEGYSFVGWVDATGNPLSYETVYADMELYARYESNYCTLTFWTEGMTEITKIQVLKGTSALSLAPEFPIVAGKTAIGWSESLDKVEKDMDVIAKYIADTISVFFKFGPEENSARSASYSAGESISDARYNPTYENHEFLGWYTNKDFLGSPVTFPFIINNEMTFYAKYTSHSLGSQGLEYNSQGNNRFAVSGYTGNESIVVIPRTVPAGGDVTSVDASAFKNCDNVAFVVASNNEYFAAEGGVLFNKEKTKLYAYPSGKDASSYAVPSTVESIDRYAFYGAKNLVAITWNSQDNLKLIEQHAFENCLKLASFSAPRSLEKIGTQAFRMDSDSVLTEFKFADECELKEIANEAFLGLNSLVTITLPEKNLSSVGSSVFNGCTQLTTINISEASDYFCSKDGVLYSEDETELIFYPTNNRNIVDAFYEVETGTKRIRSSSFADSNVLGIVLPESIEYIGEYAFNSQKIKYLQFTGSSEPTTIAEKIFGNNSPYVIIPNRNTYTTFTESSEYEIIDAAANATYVLDVDGGFLYSKNLNEEITILGLLPGKYTTDVLRFMQDVTIPSKINGYNVKSIGARAFYAFSAIKTLTLSEGITTIEEYAFDKAQGLTTVNLPASLTSIMKGAFSDCIALTTVNIASDSQLSFVGEEAFANTRWIENDTVEFLMLGNVLVQYHGHGLTATLPLNTKVIAYSAFINESTLTEINLNEGLEGIDSYAFYGCSGIFHITIPNTVKNIGDSAFLYCDNLYEVVMTSITPPTLVYGLSGVFDSSVVYRVGNAEYIFNIKVVSEEAKTRYSAAEGWREYTSSIRVSSGTNRTVTYNSGGISTNVEANTIYTEMIPRSSSTDVVFAGWFNGEVGGRDADSTPIIFPQVITTDTVYYARWLSSVAETTGLNYVLINDETEYAVSSYSGSATYVVIPATHNGKPVTRIMKSAFAAATSANNENVYRIILPSALRNIDEDAFVDTKWYKQFLGDYVYINNILIEYRGAASNVVVPETISYIIAGAFKDNDYIKSITFPSSLFTIPAEAMYDCDGLTKVVFPANLGVIGEKAFAECNRLETLSFPKTIEQVAPNAFDNTMWLTNYADDCVMIDSILYKYKGAQDVKSEQTALHIPNSITLADKSVVMIRKIEKEAFKNNIKLTKVYVPYSVESIGDSAFEGCISITFVQFASGVMLNYIGQDAFRGCLSLKTFDIGSANLLTEIGENAFASCQSLTTLRVPSSLMAIGEGAYNSSGLVSIQIAANSKLSVVKANTFKDCASLKVFEVAEGGALTRIETSAFENCIALSSIIIPNNIALTEISSRAFYDCSELRSIILPTSLLNIGEDAFANVPYINANTDNKVSIGSVLLRYSGQDSVVVISKDIVAISKQAFIGNTYITQVRFEEGSKLVSIGEQAFKDCVNLAEVQNIPASVNIIGNNAFENTRWLNTNSNDFVQINSVLIKYKGDGLQAVIPDGITIIGEEAFFGNTRLQSIVVSPNVRTIRARAFNGMSPSSSITMQPLNPPTLDADNAIVSTVYVESTLVQISYLENQNWLALSPSVITKYTITFDMGTSGTHSIYAGAKLRYNGANITSLQVKTLYDTLIPVLDGYSFGGWFLDYNDTYGREEGNAYSNEVELPYVCTENVTFYAKWNNNETGSSLGEFSIETIESIAFGGDTVPNGYYVVGIRTGASSIIIPSDYSPDKIIGITKHGANTAFANVTTVEEISFAANTSLAYIGDGAFENCTGLKKIILPASLKYIGVNAFKGCTSLREVIFIGSAPETPQLTICEGAFSGCIALESVELPQNTYAIRNTAFEDCSALTQITVLAVNPPMVNDNPFDVTTVTTIYVNAADLVRYQSMWATFASLLETITEE